MIHQPPSASTRGSGENQSDPDGLAPLVEHLDAAYNLASWLIRNETEANDVVQEAYLRAIRGIARFRGGDSRAWLLAIVRNCCYDRMRQERALIQKSTDFDEASHSMTLESLNPETELLLAERTDLVRQSLAELPAEYREVLVLREMEQLSYREIANIAEIPLGTVMSRLSRARRQFRQTLFECVKPGEGETAPMEMGAQ